eukprot:jgi/Chlat1/8733/Chrsp9S08558
MTSASDLIAILIPNGVLAVVALLVWMLFKRSDAWYRVYYPNVALNGGKAPDSQLQRMSPIAWVKRMISTTDDEIERMSGLDGVAFTRLFSWGIQFFSGALIACCVLLIPINATGGGITQLKATTHAKQAADCAASGEVPCQFKPLVAGGFDYASMTNIKSGSPRLWAHWIVVWSLSFWVYWLLLKYYKLYKSDCTRHFAKSDANAAPYSIYVSDAPRPPQGMNASDYVRAFFTRMYPHSFRTSMAVKEYKKAEKIATELNKFQSKLEHAEWVLEKNQSENKVTKDGSPLRPTTKTGLLGLFGEKVDAVTYFREKVTELKPALLTEQEETLSRDTPAAIVSFKSRASAAVASQTLHYGDSEYWIVGPAPEPRDIYWPNLALRMKERSTRKLTVTIITFLMVVFYMVPITLISALSTLENLEKLAPFLKFITKMPALRAFLQGLLPTLALIIFMALLPALCRFLTQCEGVFALSRIDRGGTSKLFTFFLVNSWFGYTVSGSIFSNLKQMINKPGDIPNFLASSIPQTATFFMGFILLKALGVLPLELSRLIPLIIYWIKKKFLAKTDREIAAVGLPPPSPYLNFVGNYCFFLLIGIVYMVIQPLMVLFILLLLGIGLLVMRNQFLYVYAPQYDSAGKLWPLIHKRILLSLAIFQILMIGLFGLKKGATGAVGAILMIPLPFITYSFYRYCETKWRRVTEILPLDEAMNLDGLGKGATDAPDLKFLDTAYQPPFMKNPDLYLSEVAPGGMKKPLDVGRNDLAAAAFTGMSAV